MSTERLTPTSYLVLGLLAREGPSTPYDLEQHVRATLGNFWSFPHTLLYSEPPRLAALGLRWCALDPSFDVDEFDDVVELAALIAQGDVALPHTAAVLRAWHAAGFLLFP